MDLVQPFWKPKHWTSFDVVKRVRGVSGVKKVGHTGSLDPFAQGVLVVCLGAATGRVTELMELEKEYEATVKLGVATDTLDPTGSISESAEVPALSLADIERALGRFVGTIKQIPPMYSALKVGGKRLYQLAREGKTIPRKARDIQIHAARVRGWRPPDELDIGIVCGKGTYIRSLAADLASALGTVGHLTALCRIRVGAYTEADAIFMDQLESWTLIAA